MDKLSQDLAKMDPYGTGDVNAMGVHLLLSTQYGLLSIKESKTFLDYIIHQA